MTAADCGCKDAAKCGCHKGVNRMEKTARAELIAALVTDKYSGFKDGDEAILEAASDARLEEFRTASEMHRTGVSAYAKLETEHRNVSARLKVAEDRIKAGEQDLSEEEFLQRAPAPFKAVLEAHKAEEAALRAAYVSQLKDLGEHTEEELKKMPTEQLQTFAKYAHVTLPDFSGRGLPVPRTAQENNDDFTPPDPYAAGLKTLQASSKAVN